MSEEVCPEDLLAARSLLKHRYGELYARVVQILAEEDPIGLAAFAPPDEYEPEAGTILPRLREATSEEAVRRIVEEEFERWFDDRIEAGAIAPRIWEAWRAAGMK